MMLWQEQSITLLINCQNQKGVRMFHLYFFKLCKMKPNKQNSVFQRFSTTKEVSSNLPPPFFSQHFFSPKAQQRGKCRRIGFSRIDHLAVENALQQNSPGPSKKKRVNKRSSARGHFPEVPLQQKKLGESSKEDHFLRKRGCLDFTA